MSQPPGQVPSGQLAPAPTAPAKPRRTGGIIGLVVALVVVAGIITAGLLAARATGQKAIGSAKVGDCLVFEEEKTNYTRADCTDPAALYKLFGSSTNSKDCVDVPGTSRTFTTDSKSYCIGDKDVDPAKSINGIATGDCVIFEKDEPYRSVCGVGSVPVLAVIKDVDKFVKGSTTEEADLGDVCISRGAKDVRQTYAWGISSDKITTTTWDRLLCLGDEAN